uniref:Protein tyrosine phosphatase non-receptor type 20 n=1 Tax=Bos mutus grunniens TaxID=30521 RepID=A0A8B9WWT5_BOSMU
MIGEDQRGKDSDMKNLNLMMTLHSSSQETTPRPVNHKVFQNEVNSRKLKVFLRDFQHSDDFEDQFKDEAESENDGTLRKTSSFFLKQKSSSEDEELAGPSHPALQGMEIVSEKELAQLALVRPLIFNTQEESTIRDYFKILTKKVSEDEITQEFKTGASHFVKHLQFTNWPDHGTPASAEGFIKYVHYVRKSHLTGPVVVHCSAGVGRTGVFLCVDVVFCAIEKNFSFDIMNIVSQMREQRHGMVQTKEQYMFCYKIVLEVLQKLWTVK